MNKKVNKILLAVVIIVVALILVIILTLNPKTSSTGPLANQNNTIKVGDLNNSVNQNQNNPVNPSEVTPTGTISTGTPILPASGASTTPAAPAFTVVNPIVASIDPAVTAALSSMPGTNEAPKQELIKTEEIPAAALKLSVSDSGFTPKEFTIKAGQEVSLAITAVGSSSHVFIFPMASLMGLQTMVSNGETKMITFTAPNAGTYTFRDDIPEFRKNTGAMIVK